MIIRKKLFKSGGSLAIIVGKELINGKDLKEGDLIEIDINSIKKMENKK